MANCNLGFGKRGEPILTNQIGRKFYKGVSYKSNWKKTILTWL